MTIAARRLLLINPNTTRAMTELMAAQIRGLLPAGMELDTVTAASGPSVIATRESYAAGAQAALAAHAAYRAPHDVVILGCFGDPGLEALRKAAVMPVVGLAEASFHAALEHAEPFAVLTVGPAWKPILEERLSSHPAQRLCRRIVAVG